MRDCRQHQLILQMSVPAVCGAEKPKELVNLNERGRSSITFPILKSDETPRFKL